MFRQAGLFLAAAARGALHRMPQPALRGRSARRRRACRMLWALPFAGMLLSIATGPLLYPHVWEHHYGKIAAFWAACVVVPLLSDVPARRPRAHALLHTVLLEYMPFILLLLALFTVAGGIYVAATARRAGRQHDPARHRHGARELVGTTGASMILIRPLIRANDDRATTSMSSSSSSSWSRTSAARSRRSAIRRCSSASSRASISSGRRRILLRDDASSPASCSRCSSRSTAICIGAKSAERSSARSDAGYAAARPRHDQLRC